jgi:hypothetical protein
VARALDDAAAGKIRALGVSNFTVAQTVALNHFLGTKLVATQPEISPLRLTCIENGELDQAMMLGLTPLAWSPLGGGRLADPQTPREQAVAAALDVVARDQGVSRMAAAYGWLMAHPSGSCPSSARRTRAHRRGHRCAEGPLDPAGLVRRAGGGAWRGLALSSTRPACFDFTARKLWGVSGVTDMEPVGKHVRRRPMQGDDNQIHIETDKARGGSTPGVVRWMPLVGLSATIVGMALIWALGSGGH